MFGMKFQECGNLGMRFAALTRPQAAANHAQALPPSECIGLGLRSSRSPTRVQCLTGRARPKVRSQE